MSRIRLELDLEELHKVIAESIGQALEGQGLTLARLPRARPAPLDPVELDAAIEFLGRSAASALTAFTVSDAPIDGEFVRDESLDRYGVEPRPLELGADGFDLSERDYDPDEDRTP